MLRKRVTVIWLCIVVVVALFSFTSFAAEKIKIGFFAPLTGFAAADGASAKQAVEMAVKEINQRGGISGKEIELVVYDDRADSKEAVTIANKLIERDKVIVAVSGSYSMPTRASAPIFQKAKIPMVTGYSVHPDITRAGNYIFRCSFVGTIQGAAGAEIAVKKIKAKKIAVLTMDNDFGRTLAKSFAERAKKLGAEIVLENVYSLGEKDYTPYLTKVKELNPDLLYTSGYYSEAAMICRQSRDLGLKMQIMGEEGFDSPMFIDLAGDAAEGVIITTNLNRDDPRPVVQNFIKNYKETYKMDPDMVGASAYDALCVAAKAIEVGGTDPKAIRDAIAKTKNFDGVTGIIRGYNKLGEVMKPVQVQIVKNGEFRYFAEVTDPEIITPPSE